MIKGFDEAVLFMVPGEKKVVTITSDNAYGQKNDEMLFEFPMSDFPPDMKPEVGLELQMNDNEGNNFTVVIAEIFDDYVILDANHPLSGQDLVFEIELVSIA